MNRSLCSHILPAGAAALGALLLLSGCFTGVEGTAKIKDTTRGNKSVPLSAEQTLLLPALPQPPRQWSRGKRFIVDDGRFDVAFSPASVSSTLNPGDTLYFQSMAGDVRLAGDSVTDIFFSTSGGNRLTYRVEAPLSAVRGRERLAVPFTIDAAVVDSVRRILVGRKFWTLRAGRNGRKFEHVEVSRVLAGTADYPVLVVAGTDSIPMVVESKSVSARTFDNLFSLSNPRDRYPQISDKIWDNICRGKVAVEMTTDECRLALGAPDNVERYTAYNGIIEQWTYKNGVYLVFTDGLLTRFRQ